ncbi:MAG: anti-sigma factor [Gemmataceae bacterium]|nr:anti-sigma factor [Gemmataceae bacterium]
MDCRDVQNLLHPYSDGELDLVRHLQIEHHLAECAACAEHQLGLRRLREALASAPLYHHAPDALRARLAADLRSAPATPSRRGRRRPRALLWATAAGIGLVAAAAVTTGALLSRASTSAETKLVEQVVAGHVRSLQADHLTDVASSDRHTVKPWFRGKLDYSPQVPDLAGEGYPLSGGRLDYLADRPVAALVYHRRLHAINVFTWPAPDADETPVRALARQGFHVCYWQRAGMAYWVISDLNAQELDEFAGLLRQHSAAPPP